jgi:hypothetical protein
MNINNNFSKKKTVHLIAHLSETEIWNLTKYVSSCIERLIGGYIKSIMLITDTCSIDIIKTFSVRTGFGWDAELYRT